MKKKIITYGVSGLMECVMSIPVGKTHMRVEFTGGVLTSYGNTPATFTTKDPLKQSIIENSPQFKAGRIKVVNGPIETEEEVDNYVQQASKAENKDNTNHPSEAVFSPSKKDKKDNPAPKPVDESSADTTIGKDPSSDNSEAEEPSDEDESETPSGEADAEESKPKETSEDGKTVVEVESLDDAKNYLNEKFGIPTRQLRSGKAINAKAAENNIVFKGLE